MISQIITTLLLCVFSSSNTNNNYPSYQYCANVGAEFYVPVPAVYDNDLNYFTSEAFIDFNALLYFNDSTSFVLSDFTFNWRWEISKWDTDESDWVQYDYYYGTYTYTGNSYTNETFDSFNFGFTYTQYHSSHPKFVIDNEGDDIYTFNASDSSYLAKDDTELVYVVNGTYLYGQIQQYISETEGYQTGYNTGYGEGYGNGYNVGYDDGSATGYNTGYNDGYNEGSTQDEVAVAIFSGIISVGLIPINFFLACLNFEVFGINIGAFVSALLTIAIVVIITRMIVSGGNGGDK